MILCLSSHEHLLRRLIGCSYGERPASWRRRCLIRTAREQQCCLGSIPPALRSSTVGATSSGSEQAFPDPFRCSDTSAARGLFNGRPAFVIHAEIALRGLPCSGPTGLARFLNLLLHAHSIWAPTKYTSLYLVGGQKLLALISCTQQLGVMTQRKNPGSTLASRIGANNNPAVDRQNAATLHSCTKGRPSQKGNSVANVLKKDLQLQVVHLLVEGNSIRSIVRLTGVHKKTVTRILVKVGNACRNLLDERMRDLNLRHVQVDEIWTFVQKKQARVPVGESAQNSHVGDRTFSLRWTPTRS